MRGVAAPLAVLLAGCSFFPPRGPSGTQRAKLEQQVGPLITGPTSMRSALLTLVSQLREPVVIDICDELQDKSVTITTYKAERLDLVLQSVATQSGARLRLYVGEHGEVARPTFFCSSAEEGHLVTLGR